MTYVAAWPRWVASYGVMPHVYIVTTGPGLERHDRPAGGVVEAHRRLASRSVTSGDAGIARIDRRVPSILSDRARVL